MDWKQEMQRSAGLSFLPGSSFLYADVAAEARSLQAAYQQGEGAAQRERSQDTWQAGYYDMPWYRSMLVRMLRALPRADLVVDLGCGDGRFMRHLLSEGFRRVVGVDFNQGELARLHASLPPADGERVLLVCGDVAGAPLWPGRARGVLLLEVAYIQAEPLLMYERAYTWLQQGGLVLASNVAPEAYLMHALLNRDWRQVRRVVEESRYVDRVGGAPVEVHLFSRDRMTETAHEAGFDIVASEMIPGEAGLLLHALRQSRLPPAEWGHCLSALSRRGDGIPRLHVDLLRKPKP